jgi:hypothetical protein
VEFTLTLAFVTELDADVLVLEAVFADALLFDVELDVSSVSSSKIAASSSNVSQELKIRPNESAAAKTIFAFNLFMCFSPALKSFKSLLSF